MKSKKIKIYKGSSFADNSFCNSKSGFYQPIIKKKDFGKILIKKFS